MEEGTNTSKRPIVDKNEASGSVPAAVDDPDERSIFVKNVHFTSTADELKTHFSDCGNILRVTIPIDKFTQKSKG